MNKKYNKKWIYVGTIISLFLIAANFISVTQDFGTNYIVNTTLLAIMINYNPFIFAAYILIIIYIFLKGFDVIGKK